MTSRIAAALLALLVISGCIRGPSLPTYGMVPDFELTDQTGQTFRSKDKLDGHVWVANFMFTTCMGPCPRMSSELKQLRDATGDAADRRIVSFTIDPQRDTPAALAAYSARYKADPNVWFFLTGPQPALQHLSKDVFMLQDIDGSFQHSTRFVLVDQKSRIRGFYDSSDANNMKQLIADIRALARAGA